MKRLYKQKRYVSDKRGTSYAPAIFVKEQEAKDLDSKKRT